jgi:hypothetical protein
MKKTKGDKRRPKASGIQSYPVRGRTKLSWVLATSTIRPVKAKQPHPRLVTEGEAATRALLDDERFPRRPGECVARARLRRKNIAVQKKTNEQTATRFPRRSRYHVIEEVVLAG